MSTKELQVVNHQDAAVTDDEPDAVVTYTTHPMTVVTYVTGLAGAGSLVGALVAEMGGHADARSWFLVGAGTLVSVAFCGLADDYSRGRNKS